jgi:hypothetical protein
MQTKPGIRDIEQFDKVEKNQPLEESKNPFFHNFCETVPHESPVIPVKFGWYPGQELCLGIVIGV